MTEEGGGIGKGSGTGEGGGVTPVRRLVHVVRTAELSREGRGRERGRWRIQHFIEVIS